MKRYIDESLVPKVFSPEFDMHPIVSVLALSDTIVFSAQPAVDANLDDTLRWGLVDLVCQCVGYAIRRAAQRSPPLTYRGAVNFGRMLVEQRWGTKATTRSATSRCGTINAASCTICFLLRRVRSETRSGAPRTVLESAQPVKTTQSRSEKRRSLRTVGVSR